MSELQAGTTGDADVVRELLRDAGLRRALEHLNARTRHRYTGVYYFDPPRLRSLELFDREFPRLRVQTDVAMEETYCSVVEAGARHLTISDARQDVRLRTHPARERYLAYCGVPLFDGGGSCFGSLCHFDHRPRVIAPSELALLGSVAGDVASVALHLLPAGREALRREARSAER